MEWISVGGFRPIPLLLSPTPTGAWASAGTAPVQNAASERPTTTAPPIRTPCRAAFGSASKLLHADPGTTRIRPSPLRRLLRHAPFTPRLLMARSLPHVHETAPPGRGIRRPTAAGPQPRPSSLRARRRMRLTAPRAASGDPQAGGCRAPGAALFVPRGTAARGGDGQPIRGPPPCSASPCRIRS